MSITVSDVALKLRYLMHDTDMKEISAPQMLSLLDDTFKMVNIELAKVSNRLPAKQAATLTMVNGSAALPSNFYKPIAIDCDNTATYYTILGNSIYTDGSTVEIIYYAEFDEVTSLTDTFDISANYIPVIARLAKAVAEDDIEKMEFYCNKVRSLGIKRDRVQTKYSMPFTVLD